MSSRSALLALLGLLAVAAPTPARADEKTPDQWNGDVAPAATYIRIAFLREDGSFGRYYYRENDRMKLDKIPLYIIRRVQNPEVRVPYFETQLSAYHLVRQNVDGNMLLFAARDGSAFKSLADNDPANEGGSLLPYFSLDTEIWRAEQAAAKTSLPYPTTKANRDALVRAPSGESEKRPATMMDQAGNMSTRISPDWTYPATNDWTVFNERVHPLQHTLYDIDRSLTCHIYPKTPECFKDGSPQKRAYEQFKKNNFIPTIDLAMDGWRACRTRAEHVLAHPGTETNFSTDEMEIIQSVLGLLKKNGTPVGYSEFLTRARAIESLPEDDDKKKAAKELRRKWFVAHWRQFVKEEIESFLGTTEKFDRTHIVERDGELQAMALHAQRMMEVDMEDEIAKDAANEKEIQERDASADAARVVMLSDKEQEWLSKVDRRAYATAAADAERHDAPAQKRERKKALAAEWRAKVAATLRPAAVDKYKAEHAKADATKEKIDATLPSMWGVPSAETEAAKKAAAAEIALTEAEVKKFTDAQAKLAEYAKNPRSLTADQHKVQDDLVKAYEQYLGKRRGVDNPQNRTVYDPIALRQATVAARAAIGLDGDGKPVTAGGDRTRRGGGRGTGDEGSDEVSDADLTADEIAMLTPREKAEYEGTAGAATRKQWNRKLRERIRSENRAPYAPPAKPEELSVADFDKLPLWQKRRFCNDFVPAETGAAAAAGDRRAPDLQSAGTGQSADDLAASEAATRAQGGRAAMSEDQRKALRDRFGQLCSKLPAETMPEIDPGTGGSDHRTEVPDPGLGADKEEDAKKEKKGPSDHAFNAMRGAILGALIGSLFGPLGAIIGAAVMGLAMYGFSKWKNPDKDE